MSAVYLVTWAGGYDPTSYLLVETLEEAERQAREWAADLKEGDEIEVIEFLRTDAGFVGNRIRRIFIEVSTLEVVGV